MSGFPIIFPNGSQLQKMDFYCRACNTRVQAPTVIVRQWPETVATVKLSGACHNCGQWAESNYRIRQNDDGIGALHIEEIMPGGTVKYFMPSSRRRRPRRQSRAETLLYYATLALFIVSWSLASDTVARLIMAVLSVCLITLFWYINRHD